MDRSARSIGRSNSATLPDLVLFLVWKFQDSDLHPRSGCKCCRRSWARFSYLALRMNLMDHVILLDGDHGGAAIRKEASHA
jgi:hypothetical protein